MALTIACSVSAVLCLALPAQAAPASGAATLVKTAGAHGPISIDATHVRYQYFGRWVHGSWGVDVFWGFDYSPATNHLRAWAEMDPVGSSSIHLQADPLNLGDRNGVLRSITKNVQSGYLVVETDYVNCHYPSGFYISNLHHSIRWPDGVLWSGLETGQWGQYASVICT